MTLQSLGRSVFRAVAPLLAAAAFAQVPSSQHVVLVIDENSSFSDVTANMPWLVGQGDASGYAANYKSDNGGSLLNYLWLASGSCESSANCTLPAGTHDFNCTGNACYYPGSSTSDPITDDNIFRKLNNAGISWKVYAQSYSAAGGKVTTSDNSNVTSDYRGSNGATCYSDVMNNGSVSASKVDDLAQLTNDIASGKLHQFMIIVPDGNHDAHDCPVGMSSCTEAQKLAAADDFLSGTLDPILSTPDFQPGGSGLIIVTFDECGGGTNSGCGAAVYTAVIGPQVAPHTVSQTTYKHENTLRTILDSLGVRTYPGAAASAADMSDFFSANGSKPEVTVSSPASGEVLSSPVVVQASAVPTSGHTVSGWTVYVDSASKYSTGAATAINPTLKISTGTHTILVRAWDTSGAFGDQTFSLTVNQEKPTVTVLTPASGANLGSPVNIQASASPTAGHSITGWWIYLDGTAISNFGSVTSIASNLTMGLGTQSVVVRAWDTSGAYGDQTLTLTASKKPAVVLSKPSAGANVIVP